MSLWLKANAFGAQPDAHQLVVCRDVQRRAVIPERAVRGWLPGRDRPEMLALRRNDQDTAWPGGKEVPALVDTHTIRHAFAAGFDQRRCIEELTSARDATVGLDVVRHPDGANGFGVRHVQCPLIRRECD